MPRILFVDDDDMLRRMVIMILRRCGYDVVEARNGREALEYVAELAAFDMVIRDLMMPEMDGVQLTEALRLSHPTLPIVVESANDQQAKAALAKGATSYLPKPFAPEELIKAVEDVLRVAG